MKVVDERVSIISDPLDPEAYGNTFANDGQPTSKTTWIENGVVKNLPYDPTKLEPVAVMSRISKIVEVIRSSSQTFLFLRNSQGESATLFPGKTAAHFSWNC